MTQKEWKPLCQTIKISKKYEEKTMMKKNLLKKASMLVLAGAMMMG